MALTLLEAQKHAKTPQELAVVTELAGGQLMSVSPFPQHRRQRPVLEA